MKAGFMPVDGVPVLYSANYFNKAEADQLFRELMLVPEWLEVTPARKEYYVNDFEKPYTYGTGDYARTYQPQVITKAIEYIKDCMENTIHILGAVPHTLEVCFLNRYENERNQLGWHADDSPEMDDRRPIVIVTFGAEREIHFRENGMENPSAKLLLNHGSVCIMQAGMQDTHQHRIPKSGVKCGPRISLTFRGYVEEN